MTSHKGQGVDHLQSIGNFLLCIGAWILSYTGFPAEPAGALASLMALDFISGLTKAYVCGEPITSRRMKAGAASKLILLLVPLAVALAAKGAGRDLDPLLGWVISLMILAELYSFVANLYAIKTGESLPEFDVIHAVGKRIQRILEAMMDHK